MYWRYFKYIIKHKWYVFVECLKVMQPIHGIMHDMSKFLPSEFFSYAKYFHKDKKLYQDAFNKAWLLHQRRNKHHWNYWVNSDCIPIPMPSKYVMQMICDWKAMGKSFNDTAKSFYLKNKPSMNLHNKTIEIIEYILKV